MNARHGFGAAAAAVALLSGCAAPQGVNYGHPALNDIQPQPTVIVVQQPVYAAPQPAPRDNTGRAIASGLVGGLLGAAVGRGEGRVAAAALGAGLGTWLSVRD